MDDNYRGDSQIAEEVFAAQDEATAMEALDRISNSYVLAGCARKSPYERVRNAAIARIRDVELLRPLLAQIYDHSIRNRIRRRMQDLYHLEEKGL